MNRLPSSSLVTVLVLVRVTILTAFCLSIAGCRGGTDGGLIVNPEFERGPDGDITAWAFTQHTGERSFSFDAAGGTLVINRTGRERWGQAIQTLSAAGLHGKTLAFSAEISGDLDDSSGPPSSPTGVGVRISGRRPGMPLALGPTILASLSGTPEIDVGRHDWTLQRVLFSVPESATRIQLSLRLTFDGRLKIRNPRLVEHTP